MVAHMEPKGSWSVGGNAVLAATICRLYAKSVRDSTPAGMMTRRTIDKEANR
jgi:hypothetical protein